MDATGRVWERLLYLGHVGEPLQDLVHTGKVIMRHRVGHSIVVHDLYAPQLVVARVHLSPQHLHIINPKVTNLSHNFISVHGKMTGNRPFVEFYPCTLLTSAS